MKIICYGDSNTYGYDPRSFFGGRYSAENRWVDILSQATGHSFINVGLNGREIPNGRFSVPYDFDRMIVMLGTNDLLQGITAHQAALRMDTFLSDFLPMKEKLLVIAPPKMQLGEWVSNERLISQSIELASELKMVCARHHIEFADATQWDIPLCFDGVHFTEEGHRCFAAHLSVYITGGTVYD